MEIIRTILPWIQIILSILLVIAVLLQRTEAGLGAGFGGSGESFTHTRRGFEKTLLYATIVLGVLLAFTSILALVIR